MKVRIPLRRRSVGGVPCPFPVVRLRVRDRYGTFAELDFRVDTQADFTSVPVATAQQEGIPFSQARERLAVGLVGQAAVYRDRIRLVIAGREHDWPCDFIQTPLPAPGQPPRELLPALGRAGFLAEYAIEVNSEYLIITRIGPVRAWIRRRLYGIWKFAWMVHSPNQPL